MDTTLHPSFETHERAQAASFSQTTARMIQWAGRLALAIGLIALVVHLTSDPESMLILRIALGLLTFSSLAALGLELQQRVRRASRQDWRRYDQLQEVIHRIDDGFEVVSPMIPTIELDGQSLVVLRAWSAQTGKAIVLLDRDGRAIQDPELWQRSVLLIEFANACLPGVTRHRRAAINSNSYARRLASRAWKQALIENKDTFKHLGLAAEAERLLEHWGTLESFLSLRIALFQAEETVVQQVSIPSDNQPEIAAWVGRQRSLIQSLENLAADAEKIAQASTGLLTGWMENRSTLSWKRSEDLEAGLKFAYLLQSLLKRTIDACEKRSRPDIRPFQRGLELARETGLMIETPHS